MHLAHLHIPLSIPYSHSLALQNALLERHYSYKDALRGVSPVRGAHNVNNVKDHGTVELGKATATSTPSEQFSRTPAAGADAGSNAGSNAAARARNGKPTSSSPPDPTLLTFSTHPTYTVGRRHLLANPISKSQQAFLTAEGLATFHASPRGGLLTYHAPGQLTGYIVADLRRHGITARCWVKLLEESVMRTCAHWGVQTMRTEDPGVWIKNTTSQMATGSDRLAEGREQSSAHHDAEGDSIKSNRKICAIGVQVSRGITSHGIGLNIFDATFPVSLEGRYDFTSTQTRSPTYDPRTAGYLSWGFSRIVACGLEGKSVTWLDRECSRPDANADARTARDPTSFDSSLEDVANVFAREVVRGLNDMRGQGKEAVEDVYRIEERDVFLASTS
ncbi:hypothetical protein LTR47_003227 [Exophiala xenobiotica]|nr:hypothetical protein LTR47_003227 [Exophiala xenobiotica]KAK5250460.1 hypothetical protein LTS06_004713 [Exophiala xenobiotica]KAK5262163.1 hypothetical protein LTR40_000729 [Exophiala xenobiotica]KAK5353984.1 hypothetical protein LTR61_002679 [Exophiala xenobiotica]KAK5364096.1 hypothetical protein LTS03_009402 [Exophiala xenobiotica]